MTKEEKLAFIKMSLQDKINRSKALIMEWNGQFKGKTFVSFSGGKDSTVLLHLVRSTLGCENTEAVFINTGLEYPEIVNFVKKQENTKIIKPKLTFKQVIEKYGYPVISKEQSKYLYDYRTTKSEHIRDLRINGGVKGGFKISEKWKFLINAPFKISDKCCTHLKKNPSHEYMKQTDKKPFIGVMAGESNLRLQSYLKGECNSYKEKFPASRPLFFWTEKDIKDYIEMYNLEICELYTKHGFKRTGCMFCMYGYQSEADGNTRFDRMKKSHPKIYEYCMDKLGLRKVIEFIKGGNTNEYELYQYKRK